MMRLPRAIRAARPTALAAAGVVIAAVLVRFVLPSHAPDGVLLEGLFDGLREALIAAALLVVWQSSRIVNFAQVALGVVAPTMFFDFGQLGIVGVGRLPWVVALLLGVLLGVVFAGLIELLFVRRFFTSPRLVLTVVTIVAAPVVVELAGKFTAKVPLFAHDTRFIYLSNHQDQFKTPFSSWGFSVFPIRFGFGQLLNLVVPLLALAGLAWFLRRSRTGAALRGGSENPDRALLLGINVRRLSTIAWCLAGLLGSLYGVLSGVDLGSYTSVGSGGSGTTAVIALTVPLVGLALGRMRGLTVAALASVALSILGAGLTYSYPTSQAFSVVVFVLLVAAMFLQRSVYGREERGLTASAEAAREFRPTPAVLAALPGVKLLRRGGIALALAAALFFPYVVPIATARAGATSLCFAVFALSIVVVTGWGGLISLGQVAVASIAAVTYANLVGSAHWPFLLAMPVSVTLAALVALAVGQPALRLRGPFLPVLTLVFAIAVQAILFASPLTDHIVPATIPFPHVPFFAMDDFRHYYYFCLLFAALVALAVRRLRNGRVGRVLVAIREDEYGVQPFGINAGRSRVAVFVLSGAIAGLGGVLYVPILGAQSLVPTPLGNFPDFSVTSGIEVLIVALVGGVGSVLGAVIGALYVGMITLVLRDPEPQRFATNAGLAVLLFLSPGGIGAIVYTVRDALLRIVALRRRILVPGLFREIELAALRQRRAPLAPPSDSRGLATLPANRRYARDSDLYPSARSSQAATRAEVVGA